MLFRSNVSLQGWLKQRYQSGLLRYRTGKIRPQDFLTAWLDHLCLAISVLETQQVTHIIGTDKQFELQTIEPQQALAYLQQLIELYYQGLNQPLAYFPKTAMAAIQAHIGRDGSWKSDEETEQKALTKMAECFNDGYLFAGEGCDDYIQRVWPQWNDDVAQDANQLAALVLQAVVVNSKEIKPE